MQTFDLVVIGGGSAGLTAAIIGGRVGARVLLVDKESLGGDCLHHGCVPSKALIRTAKVAHTVKRAKDFGVETGDVAVNFAGAMAHVTSAIAEVAQHDTPEKLAERGVEVKFGGAKFLSATRLRVGDEEIAARHIIIAVGARPLMPRIPGLDEAGAIDHIALFGLHGLPRRLAVIGGGPIGVEMGQALARLGAHVTIIEGENRILRRDDGELVEILQKSLQKELALLTGTRVTEASRAAESKLLTLQMGENRHQLECDEILVAAGRTPNLEGLDLAAAGVDHHEGGIIVDAKLRTSVKNIWACGDCTGGFQFTHFAEAQARVAARNALFRGTSRFGDQVVPWTTFCDPELAHVGLTEKAARDAGQEIDVFRFDYRHVDRAVCDGETVGRAKVVCDGGGKILGASILGPQAGEALAELVLAMEHGMTLQQVTQAIHVYPTLNRVVRRLGDERFLEHGVSATVSMLFGRYRGASS